MPKRRYVKFETLISLTDAGDWLKGEYLYICRGRKQIAQVLLEDLRIPKDTMTDGNVRIIDFILEDLLESDNGRPLGQRIGELALLLKRKYAQNTNAFVWRGLHREIFPVILVEQEYRLENRTGKAFMGGFEFYTINPSYFRERQETIRQCIETYHSRMERKAEKTKSSSEPQP
jgi:hypothetical protein